MGLLFLAGFSCGAFSPQHPSVVETLRYEKYHRQRGDPWRDRGLESSAVRGPQPATACIRFEGALARPLALVFAVGTLLGLMLQVAIITWVFI
jgi:hypothetical protein